MGVVAVFLFKEKKNFQEFRMVKYMMHVSKCGGTQREKSIEMEKSHWT